MIPSPTIVLTPTTLAIIIPAFFVITLLTAATLAWRDRRRR